MYIFINILILIIVIFFYIHIYSYKKTSNYLEIYELDNPSKDNLENIFNYKQPVLIKNLNLKNLDNIGLAYLENNYFSFDINIYNINNDNNIYLPLIDSLLLFKNDISSNYISICNSSFLTETTLEKVVNNYDLFFRPLNTINMNYDIILGSKNSYTKLKNELYSRNYIIVLSGKIKVTLIPPKYSKYLHTITDYTNMESKSQINIIKLDDKYKHDYSKIKSLEIILDKHDVINIPPYWFYQIEILEENTLLYNFKYRTLLFNASIIPEICLSILQKHNTKEIFTKIINYDKNIEI
jgi:hypothetical protein